MQTTSSESTLGELLITELQRKGSLGVLTYKEIQLIKTYDSLEELKPVLELRTFDWDPEPESVANWVELLTTSPEKRWESQRAERFPWDNLVWFLAIATFLSLGLVVWSVPIAFTVAGALYITLAVVETVGGFTLVGLRSFSETRGGVWRKVDPHLYWFIMMLRWGSIVFFAVVILLNT